MVPYQHGQPQIRGAMFNATKHFWEINREERAFVALLAHLMLANPAARDHVVAVLDRDRVEPPLLDPAHLEVYVEAAPLRDYWRDLGPYLKPSGETHDGRRQVLQLVLGTYGIDAAAIDQHAFFWTGAEAGDGKLWSPGHWSVKGIEATEWRPAATEDLITIKQAWNSKPDLMLVSGASAVLIEAKLESGFGVGQLRNARRVTELMHLLAPDRFRPRPRLMTLTLAGMGASSHYVDGAVRWRDVLMGPVLDEADAFSAKALGRLRTAYPQY